MATSEVHTGEVTPTDIEASLDKTAEADGTPKQARQLWAPTRYVDNPSQALGHVIWPLAT